MRGWSLGLLAALGFGFAALAGSWHYAPGFMDAEYYFAGGLRLVEGYGFREEILWNYLDDPVGLPHPSHGYWMPLASLIAAFFMGISGSHTFRAAQAGFLLIAALIPPLTALLAFRLTQQRHMAWLAGFLAAIPGYYLIFLGTVETVGITLVLGALFFLLVGEERRLTSLALGGVVGLLHLTRSEGPLWLGVALLAVTVWRREQGNGARGVAWARQVLLCLLGYLSVMGPWFVRNTLAFGAPLPPGNSRALWVIVYEEMFLYPASLLTAERWWQAGLERLLQARSWALGWNLQTALAVQGEIFLAPLIVFGAWRLRGDRRVQVGFLAWSLLLLSMTLVVPYQGARGGFFHAGAAVQPLFWALAPMGLQVFVEWGQRKRGWNPQEARRVFAPALVVFAMALTTFVIVRGWVEEGSREHPWNLNQQRYSLAEQFLQQMGFGKKAVIMVGNPPGYYVATRRPAIIIPYGDLGTILAVGRRYGAKVLLVDEDTIQAVELWQQPGDRPGLRYLGQVGDMWLYALEQP